MRIYIGKKKKKRTKNNFIKEIDQNELISHKNKKLCMALNYIEYFLALLFAVTRCVFFPAFASLVDVPT